MSTAQNVPFPPRLKATLYLYDHSEPVFHVAQPGPPHVTVETGGLHIAAWTPDTLRRFARVCFDAADALERELDDGSERPVAAMGAMH